MTTKETLLGLAVVAVLVTAAFLLRNRPAGSPNSSAPAPRGTPEVPDISLQDSTVDLGDTVIRFSVAARPITAFSSCRFRVRAESRGETLPMTNGILSFAMTMPMGDHRASLAPGPAGWMEAEAVLPSCPSGHRRWFGTLEAVVASRPRVVKFQFDLDPGNASTGPR